MSSKQNPNVERVLEAIKIAAEMLDKHEASVTRRDLLSNGLVTDWALKQLDTTFNQLKKINFPNQDKDLVTIKKTKDTNSYINKLEKELGTVKEFEQELLTALNKNIKPVKLSKPYKAKNIKTPLDRQLVAMLNDTHYGLNVNSDEVDQVNKYSWIEASRRTAYFINQVCEYKIDKRGETSKITLLLAGDLIGGTIHGLTGRDYDLITHQMNGALHILTNAVVKLAENFKEVEVRFQTGNHEDLPHRREGGRVLSQIYDSFGGMLFYALSNSFKNVKNVKFLANKTLYQIVDLPGGRMMFTHGHLMFSKQLGNPGTSINTKSLSDAVMQFNNSEVSKGRKKVDLVMVGHTHVSFSLITRDGTRIYNAPSLSGIDSYAFSLGITHNNVGQVVFETTKNHIFGDNRLIDVSKADNMKDMDLIIPPYNYELVSK